MTLTDYLERHDAAALSRGFRKDAQVQLNYTRSLISDPLGVAQTVDNDEVKKEQLDDAFKRVAKFVEGDLSTDAILKARNIPAADDAMKDWLEARLKDRPNVADHVKPAKKRFPVFLVAARGGGFYSAYHTALTLARLQDLCPRFREHVFAISGVSGGSLGASLFAAISDNIKESGSPGCAGNASRPRIFEATVKDYFTHDLLSALISTFLFYDIPRIVMPFIPSRFHRGTAMEASFAQAFDAVKQPSWINPFEEPFFSRWSPNGHTPALLFGSVSVSAPMPVTVGQIYFSSVKWMNEALKELAQKWRDEGAKEVLEKARIDPETLNDPSIIKKFQDLSEAWGLEQWNKKFADDNFVESIQLLDIFPDINMLLGEAASISSRFPLVTPSASIAPENGVASQLQIGVGDRIQLADGGYWDNTGLDALVGVIKRLEATRERWQRSDVEVTFHVISFFDPHFEPNKTVFQIKEKSAVVSEAAVPLRAMIEMRPLSDGRQFARLARMGYTPINFTLIDSRFNPALSWSLSNKTKLEIERRSGLAPQEVDAEPIICCDRLGRKYHPNLHAVQQVMELLAGDR